MSKLVIRDKYKLELHWSSLTYFDNTTAVLKDAYFSGPVLKDAEKIKSPDFIDLDMTIQHLEVIDSFYIVRLSWGGAQYKSTGVVMLENAMLSSIYLKNIYKLNEGDSINIDTSKHEVEKHPYNLVYASQVVRKQGDLYSYKDK